MTGNANSRPTRPRALRDPEGRLQRVLPASIRVDEETLATLGWFGFAVLWAQALEQTLAAYLTLARPDSMTITAPRFRKSLVWANTKSLNQLLDELSRRKLSSDEQGTLDLLRDRSDVFIRRDNLAHHFLRRPSRRRLLATPEGRSELVADAQQAAGEFRFWVFTLAPLVAKHAVRVGRESSHLAEHAEWLLSVEETYGPLDVGKLAMAALEPTLALEIAEMMEELEKGH